MAGSTELIPLVTLEAIFGPDVIYNPCQPRTAGAAFMGVRRADPAVRDFFTTTFVSVAGGLRLICSTGGLTPGGLELLRRAGLPIAPRTIAYASDAEYQGILDAARAADETVAFQHRHPAEEAPAALSLVDPDLLSFLNNKAHLADLVPETLVPERRLTSPDEMDTLRPTVSAPVVLKGATPFTSGAAGAVVIARSAEELAAGRRRLDRCEAVFLEEFLPFVRTWCLNFATDGSSVLYLGAAEQVTDDAGAYLGNWMDGRMEVPDAAVSAGEAIMHRGIGLGYRGFAGFDMGVTDDGRLVVIDLNFRLCGSTAPLVWWPSLRQRRPEHDTARCLTLRGEVPFSRMLEVAGEATEHGWLLPFGCYDPAATAWPGSQPMMRAVITGPDRETVEVRRHELGRHGLLS